MFKKIGLAVTFSPNSKALLKETKLYSDQFSSEVIFIHVGSKNDSIEERLKELIVSGGFAPENINIVWGQGDPAKVINKKCEENNIDLLIAGALEKEKVIKYYIGSVARKLMRDPVCSLFILTEPSIEPKPFKKISVQIDYSYESEILVNIAYQLAIKEKATEICLIREYEVPGLAITVYDTGSTDETEKIRKKWHSEEKEKMDVFINELNLTEIKVRGVCLYGKEGWEASNFVKENDSDLLIMSAPSKKLSFIDRFFQHNEEFIFKELPCSILLIK
ncbi:MAG: universal stress protein [Ignavibacteriaceae bacterium]|jgi:nucleotide-binding universal stress UspA family protein|nr:universal stress protein [Ignavibacteriaceae bacterium]